MFKNGDYMFKVTFNSANDVIDFVERFGSVKGLWKHGNIDITSSEFIEHAVSLSEDQVDVVLHTVNDSYDDNNGHRLVEIVADDVTKDFDIENFKVVTSCNYGESSESFINYLKGTGKKGHTELFISLLSYYDLVNRASKLQGKIR